MHARSQRAEPARSAGGVLAKPTRSAGGTSWFALAPRWHQRGALVQRCAHCAPHSSTWGSSDLKDGCPLETCSSQDRDSLPPRVGLRSDAVMSNLLSSPQTPGGTAVLLCHLPPSSTQPIGFDTFSSSCKRDRLKKKRDEKHYTSFIGQEKPKEKTYRATTVLTNIIKAEVAAKLVCAFGNRTEKRRARPCLP